MLEVFRRGNSFRGWEGEGACGSLYFNEVILENHRVLLLHYLICSLVPFSGREIPSHPYLGKDTLRPRQLKTIHSRSQGPTPNQLFLIRMLIGITWREFLIIGSPL